MSHSTFFSARIILVSTHEADVALRALKRHPAISWVGDKSLELWASTLRSFPMNEDVRRQGSPSSCIHTNPNVQAFEVCGTRGAN